MYNQTMSNFPNSTTPSSLSSPCPVGIADRLLAPVGVTLLLLLISVLAYLYAWKRDGAEQLFDEVDATTIDEDEIDGDEYFGVSEETMRSFPKFAYSRLDEFVTSASSSRSCTICLHEYEGTDVIKMLPVCDHFFHQVCVERWLRRHPTCPICRIPLLRSTRFFRLS
ncbi:hypothetical protein MLD38_009863 [Melastoma candidum]|uniref:Uncharacterized protein n=1 Tax=Melastoma candidum TaxID=119954 RepID=A0ACB9S1Z3_9MYRT|nr:hypothetical protein MLD38_009863 [Melastoma candidum]